MGSPAAQGKLRICPARNCDGQSGFSFLEALVALSAAVLIVSAAGHALSVAFRSEITAGALEEGRRVLWSMAAARYGEFEAPTNFWAARGWTIETRDTETGRGAQVRRWQVVSCAKDSLELLIAFQDPAAIAGRR